jgi:hypothetical protein
VAKIRFKVDPSNLEQIKTFIHDRISQLAGGRSASPTMDSRSALPKSDLIPATSTTVMRKGRKTALRVLASREEAEQWMQGQRRRFHSVQGREDKKCKDYCSRLPILHITIVSTLRGRMMDLKFPMLTADDIEVKVKKVTSKGAIALLYKTARVDMNILDKAVGPLNWKCSYHDVKGNLYCEISIYDPDKKEWVSKRDCGIESRDDGEGNQHKGEASDAFKRAGFKWASVESFTLHHLPLSTVPQRSKAIDAATSLRIPLPGLA